MIDGKALGLITPKPKMFIVHQNIKKLFSTKPFLSFKELIK